MEKNIVIVHFNTPLMTECLIHSINHFTPNTNIYIFDNSDKEPFTAIFDNVKIIDNTKGQIINFDEWLKGFPNKVKNSPINHYGSAKHCYTIQKCMDILQKNFLLMDSDILLKRDVSGLFQEDCIFVSEVRNKNKRLARVLPFLCFINTLMCKEKNIKYFNGDYMLEIGNKRKDVDTGGWFFEETKNIKHKNIIYNDYIEHFAAASYIGKTRRKSESPFKWILNNEKLWNFNNLELKERVLLKYGKKEPQLIIKKEVIRKNTRQSHLLARRRKLMKKHLT